MKSKNIFNKTILVLTILLLFFSLVNVSFGKITTLKAASGSMGGAWFTAVASIAELIKDNAPEIDIKVTPGGGIANPARIGENESQLGFSYPYIIQMALKGIDLYDGDAYPDIRVICSLGSTDYDQFVIGQDVAKDKNINSVDDIFLNKIPLNFGWTPVGTTEEFRVRKLLEHYGLTYDDLASWGGKVYYAQYNDLQKLMQDRHIDVVYVGGPIPWAGLIEMNFGRPIRLLSFPEGYRDMLVKEYFYTKADIPKGTYSDTVAPTDIASLNNRTMLMVNKDVPDDIVYTITKILGDNIETVRALHNLFNNFDPSIAWDTGVPLHPGAEKYFKEAGYMK
jgi:hypothetical protein